MYMYVYLRGCQRTICFLSVAHEQHRQNAFMQNRFFYVFSEDGQPMIFPSIFDDIIIVNKVGNLYITYKR